MSALTACVHPLEIMPPSRVLPNRAHRARNIPRSIEEAFSRHQPREWTATVIDPHAPGISPPIDQGRFALHRRGDREEQRRSRLALSISEPPGAAQRFRRQHERFRRRSVRFERFVPGMIKGLPRTREMRIVCHGVASIWCCWIRRTWPLIAVSGPSPFWGSKTSRDGRTAPHLRHPIAAYVVARQHRRSVFFVSGN